jgi:hypothetical protein
MLDNQIKYYNSREMLALDVTTEVTKCHVSYLVNNTHIGYKIIIMEHSTEHQSPDIS